MDARLMGFISFRCVLSSGFLHHLEMVANKLLSKVDDGRSENVLHDKASNENTENRRSQLRTVAYRQACQDHAKQRPIFYRRT